MCASLDQRLNPGRESRVRAAFTLIEIIVVMILLVVAAGLIAPRLAGQPARQARTEAEGVAGLLSTLADQLAGSASAGGDVAVLQYDGSSRTLSLARRVAPSATTPGRRGDWTYEPLRLVPPVTLEQTVIAQVVLDGRIISGTPGKDWRIAISAADARPNLNLVLAQRRAGEATGSGASAGGGAGGGGESLEPGGDAWQIDLSPAHSSAALRVRPAGTSAADSITPESVDLDLAGAGDAPW